MPCRINTSTCIVLTDLNLSPAGDILCGSDFFNDQCSNKKGFYFISGERASAENGPFSAHEHIPPPGD